jgi:transcriptional regulator with XRE-family HTH domain
MKDQIHPVDAYIGERIRQLRREKLVTQQALAQRIGVQFQQLQKYETGVNRVSGSRLWLIARELETDVAAFFPKVMPNKSTSRLAMMDEEAIRIGRVVAKLPSHARAAMLRIADVLRQGLLIDGQDDIEPLAEAETEGQIG